MAAARPVIERLRHAVGRFGLGGLGEQQAAHREQLEPLGAVRRDARIERIERIGRFARSAVAFVLEGPDARHEVGGGNGGRHRGGGGDGRGWHTAAMSMRMMCDGYLLRASSLGSPGIESLKWLQPVRPGDTLRVRLTVLEARPLKSKPGVGLVKSRHEVLNQRGEVVMEMQGYGMFGMRRPASP